LVDADVEELGGMDDDEYLMELDRNEGLTDEEDEDGR
jgi:hypothetical protein